MEDKTEFMIIIDRILNEIAICEKDGAMVNIPISQIDGQVHEGAILKASNGGTRYAIDIAGTKARAASIAERFNALKKKSE